MLSALNPAFIWLHLFFKIHLFVVLSLECVCHFGCVWLAVSISGSFSSSHYVISMSRRCLCVLFLMLMPYLSKCLIHFAQLWTLWGYFFIRFCFFYLLTLTLHFNILLALESCFEWMLCDVKDIPFSIAKEPPRPNKKCRSVMKNWKWWNVKDRSHQNMKTDFFWDRRSVASSLADAQTFFFQA